MHGVGKGSSRQGISLRWCSHRYHYLQLQPQDCRILSIYFAIFWILTTSCLSLEFLRTVARSMVSMSALSLLSVGCLSPSFEFVSNDICSRHETSATSPSIKNHQHTRYPYGLPSYHLVMFKEDNQKYPLNSVLALLIVQNVCRVVFQGPVQRL